MLKISVVGDIWRLFKDGRLNEALNILRVMECQSPGTWVDSSTYDTLLQGCVQAKAISAGKLVHAHIIQIGFKLEISLETKLVTMYAKCGSLADARRILEQMHDRDLVSWTTMIAEYARQGYDHEALDLYYEMQRAGIQPDQVTFASVIPACSSMECLTKIHQQIVVANVQSNLFVGSGLVDMYAKCGRIEDARKVFDKMPQRNVVSWTAMISGYVQCGQVDEALKLFEKMPERNMVSWTVMIEGYAQNGRIDMALELFWKMPRRDLFSWNVMLAGYTQNGYMDEALELFQKMTERNIMSWTLMISGYAKIGRVDEASKLFWQMPRRDLVSWNAMIAGYAQNGHVDEALKLFQEMPRRDLLSWTPLIAGYVDNGDCDKALNFFHQMQLTGLKANVVTLMSIIPACAIMGALQKGKEIHEDLIRSGFQFETCLGSVLVDMYAKCGNIDDAQKVFDKMPEQNVVAWNAIMSGYAMHGSGKGKEALQLFQKMQQSGFKPDCVTFVAVLSTCCHAGLLDDGWHYFNLMSRHYHLTPKIEHYCCMVDLLGRAGCLDEAEDFINKMQIKPNAVVWRCLLGACRIHNNIELGKRVATHLFELNPNISADYVLLSNIYAAAGMWDDKEKVRKMMKDRRVNIMPGCSWIEVNKELHTFLAGQT